MNGQFEKHAEALGIAESELVEEVCAVHLAPQYREVAANFRISILPCVESRSKAKPCALRNSPESARTEIISELAAEVWQELETRIGSRCLQIFVVMLAASDEELLRVITMPETHVYGCPNR
jgi:hypothetical protein